MDIEALDEELRGLAGDTARRDKLRRDLTSIETELRAAEAARERWQRLAAETGEDLAKLEGLTLAALFQRLFGDRDGRILEEKKLLAHARLRHDEAEAAVAPLLAERDAVTSELKAIGDVEKRRAALLQQKEAVLQARGGELAQRLLQSAAAVGGLRAAVREIDEAVAAGREAESALDEAHQELAGARSWGTVDLFGGGMMPSVLKHARLDNARSAAQRAQRHLRRFARELQDVDRTVRQFDAELGPFLRFADTFFDNLLVDWMVQDRIVGTLQQVATTRTSLRERLWELERRGQEARAALAAADAERRGWIEDMG